MPPQLVAVSEGPDIPLDKPILLIGRHQECDIQIPSRKISRRHCCIAQINDHLVVRDLCSTNGVRINGVRVTEGQLHSGDELTIGNIRYEVSLNGPGEPSKPAKISGKSNPGVAVSDSPFGSWDQPIPLKEPNSISGGVIPQAPGVQAPENGSPPDKPSSLLPDHLNLAPASGEFPPPAPSK